MALNCVSLVGKSQSGNFFGEGSTGRWRTTRNIQVSGYGNPPNPTSTGHLETITINGVNFGTGRILSVQKPAGAGVGQRGLDAGIRKFDATIEIFVEGNTDLTNFTTSTIPNLKYIDSFSEELSSSVEENGNFKYTHNIRVKLLKHSNSFNPLDAAKDIANAIFTGTNYDTAIPDLGNSIVYNRNGRKFYTESYNTITSECSFTKTYTLSQKNPSTDYTVTVNTKFTLNEAGNTDVTETGEILSLVDYPALSTALTTEIGGSFTRCNDFFNRIQDYASDAIAVSPKIESLFPQPVSVLKSIDIGGEKATYTVTYSNNKSIDVVNGYFIEETSLRSKDSDVLTICYDGQIRSFGKKGISFNGTPIYTARLAAIIGLMPAGFNLKNKNVTIAKLGKEVNYQVCFTNDQSVLVLSPFRKVDVNVSDSPAQLYHKEYVLPNTIPGKSGYKNARGHNVNISTRTVTMNVTLPRTAGQNVFYQIPSPTTYLNTLKPLLIGKCIAVFAELGATNTIYAAFFSGASASINSNRELTATLEYKYIFNKTGNLAQILIP